MSRDSENACSANETLRLPPGTRYAEQPIDASSRRSIKIRSGADRDVLIDPRDRVVVVEYFYHAEQFWKAAIPLDGVDKLFGQAFNFSQARTKRGENGPEIVFDRDGLPKRKIPILNHLQSRFTLKSGCFVELYPMGSNDSESPAHRINDFVYSVEAIGPLGVSFNVRDGLAGNLISAHRFLSTQEMVFERIVVENQYVTESPALPLNDTEKRALLTNSLLRSDRAGMKEIY